MRINAFSNNLYLDTFFRFVHITFWPILWYKLAFIPKVTANKLLFYFFFLIATSFIVSLFRERNRCTKKPVFAYDLYRFITAITFIVSLFSILLSPNSIAIFFLKLTLILSYLIVSYKTLFKYQIAEGTVGIIAALLLFTISIFY